VENAGMDDYCKGLISARLIDTKRDTRYTLKAYEFVYMIFSILEKINIKQEGDFSARQIVEIATTTAATIYGSLAEFVLSDMGIKSASDIEAIISNFSDLNIFSRIDICESAVFAKLSEKPLFANIKPKPINMENLKIFEDT